MSDRTDDIVAVDAPADQGEAMADAALPRVALVYADEGLLAHVEQAIAPLQVLIVYRAAIDQVEAAALLAARPQVALINLDDRCDSGLDELTATLDAAAVPIVFNDADISRGLDGWARARWARHLGAKLRGQDDVDPPRPERATGYPSIEAVPPVSTTNGADVSAQASQLQSEPAGAEPTSSGRPLSESEIASLVADFPSQASGAADAESMSLHVDAMLATAVNDTPGEPASWETSAIEEDAARADAELDIAGTAGSGHKAPVAVAGIDQWELVDDFTPVVSAPSEKAPVTAASSQDGLSLELEPMEQVVASVPARDSFAEMRLDVGATHTEKGS